MHHPTHIDLKKDTALTLQWSDGRVSVYPVTYLRKMSPSADARILREQLQQNPLTVLPTTTNNNQPLTVTDIKTVGNYALQIIFSDGHDTGLYSWPYLRDIDPNTPPPTNT